MAPIPRPCGVLDQQRYIVSFDASPYTHRHYPGPDHRADTADASLKPSSAQHDDSTEADSPPPSEGFSDDRCDQRAYATTNFVDGNDCTKNTGAGVVERSLEWFAVDDTSEKSLEEEVNTNVDQKYDDVAHPRTPLS